MIAGGYGMGSKEGSDMLFELAKELHAEAGASRAAVDAGFCEHDRQIGQTGVTRHPKPYRMVFLVRFSTLLVCRMGIIIISVNK